jgi:hypothetical protein
MFVYDFWYAIIIVLFCQKKKNVVIVCTFFFYNENKNYSTYDEARAIYYSYGIYWEEKEARNLFLSIINLLSLWFCYSSLYTNNYVYSTS